MIMKTRKMYKQSPIIGYLNINSLRSKILNLKVILHKAPINILCIDEIRLDETFSLQKTGVYETGLSDCHKMIFTIFRSTFIRLTSKFIKYRNYKGFNENIFCHELDQTLLKGEIYK